jgi:hypothetical protein
MVFGLLIGPTLPTLSPASRSELIVKLVPKYVRYGQIFTLITPFFGLGLALYVSRGSFTVFSPSIYGDFGLFISIGAILTLVAWAISFGILSPTANEVVRLTKESMTQGGPPPQELLQASKRLRITSAVAIVVLFVIVACMVAAATL